MSYFYPKYRDGGRGEASNERAATGRREEEATPRRRRGLSGAARPPARSQLVAPSWWQAWPPAPVKLCGRSKGQEHGTYPSTPDTLASFSLPSAGAAAMEDGGSRDS
uniref:Uncharacterized protein n=2 Tax=Oryza rufipogon TaxID=4529 RepID=A0A0E0NBS0_ORYRU